MSWREPTASIMSLAGVIKQCALTFNGNTTTGLNPNALSLLVVYVLMLFVIGGCHWRVSSCRYFIGMSHETGSDEPRAQELRQLGEAAKEHVKAPTSGVSEGLATLGSEVCVFVCGLQAPVAARLALGSRTSAKGDGSDEAPPLLAHNPEASGLLSRDACGPSPHVELLDSPTHSVPKDPG